MKGNERAQSSLPEPEGKARILVVEDEAIIAKDLASILQRQGHCVIGPAASGEESIFRAGNERPDLVLMDISLKGLINGVDAAREIKARWGIPIIYLTAYGEESPLGRPGRENGSPRLLKPFDDDDIKRILSVYLRQNNN